MNVSYNFLWNFVKRSRRTYSSFCGSDTCSTEWLRLFMRNMKLPWVRKDGSDYLTMIYQLQSLLTELLLSLIVTGYLALLSASRPTEGQIRLVNNELWSHFASSFCHEFAAWTEQFHKEPQSGHVTTWMWTIHVLNTHHKFYHYSQLGQLPRQMRSMSGDEDKSGGEVTTGYSMHLQ